MTPEQFSLKKRFDELMEKFHAVEDVKRDIDAKVRKSLQGDGNPSLELLAAQHLLFKQLGKLDQQIQAVLDAARELD